MKKLLLASSLLLISAPSLANDLDVTQSYDEKFIGTMGAQPPYGLELTNQVGYPYTLKVWNQTGKPVALDDLTIKFSLDHPDCPADVGLFNSISTQKDNIYIKQSYKTDGSFNYFELTVGAPVSLPDELKTLQHNEIFNINVISPESLGSGTIGSYCLKVIEESIRVSHNELNNVK